MTKETIKRILVAAVLTVAAGAPYAHAKKTPEIKPSYAWTVIEPLGLRRPAAIDTSYLNYSRQSVPSEISDAWLCTGNLGAEGENRIWMDRRDRSDFFFRDAQRAWLPDVSNTLFYNTRIPMTLLSFNTGGSKETTQDRLRGVFSGNINSKAQVGALVDYIYSKGSYANQAAKGLIWGLNGSYIGDRFEFQGFYNHYNNVNKENGGITDPLYITDPAQLQGGDPKIDSKSIPTNLNDAHSRIVGGELLLNSRYKVGHWHEERDENDSVTGRVYIPVTSFIWTLNYRQARHVFVDHTVSETQKFFENTYLNPRETYDKTTYYALTNTFGISMLEGFHRLAKFGLSAYFTHQLRRYNQTADTLDHTLEGLTPFPESYTGVVPHKTENLAWAGAQLTKQHGSILTYEATGRIGIIGPAAGDVNVDGTIRTRFRLFGDTVGITAYGRFDNVHAPYLMENYLSNHFVWQNDFGKERTFEVRGTLDIPHTGTVLQAGVQNIQNHIYFGPECLPVQHSGSVQVFSARLRQSLHFGAWHWDNTVTYQTSGDESVIPLPKLAIYSNMYVKFHIATLKVQLGVDCDYYTRYYSPLYQPALMSFCNQNETKVGNYPFINVYANMRLSKARFYVMMSHVNQGWTGNDYFVMPGYPLNPRRFQLGVSVDFAN